MFLVFLQALAGWESSKAQCDPGEQIWTVSSALDAYHISKALENCPGGLFRVDWNGHVTVEITINVSAGTSLTINGGKQFDAIVDGGGVTQLFHLENAALTLTNITLINGHGESGGAIHAQDGSQVHLDGMMIFANNFAASGGAIRIENGSTLSLDGHTTFANNTANGDLSIADGGALWCRESNIFSSGTTVFVNNSARHGGAAKIGWSSMAYWHGNTSFINNRAKTYGGGLFEIADTLVQFHGTTVATGTFAGLEGGAFRLGSPLGRTAKLVFNGSTIIHNNSAVALGGAIVCITNATSPGMAT